MFVLNGRVGKDQAGKPTSKNNSNVDYAISSAHVLRKVEDFDILEFSKLFSDIHSPVSLMISCAKPEHNYAVPQENVERIGRWKFEKGVDFNGNLDKNRIEHLLFKLLSYTDETTNMQKSNIDDIVTEVSDILLTSAKSTFGFKNIRNCTNKSTKQWYNADCKKAKHNFRKQNRFYKHYGSHLFKQRLTASELFYKNTMDANTIKFNNNLRDKIKTMRTKNLKEFWKLFKNDKNRDPQKISIDSLFVFFKDLKTNKSDRDEYININIIDVDSNNEMLNCKISADEIKKAVKN